MTPLRHSYIPFPKDEAEAQIVISAAHELRAYKSNPTFGRNKPPGPGAYAPGSIVVRDTTAQTHTVKTLGAEATRLQKVIADSTTSALELNLARRQLENITHAMAHVVTVSDVVAGTSPLAEGKVYVVGHGGGGDTSVSASSNSVAGVHINQAGMDISAMAHQHGWTAIDQRLSTCESAVRGTLGTSSADAPMQYLHTATKGFTDAHTPSGSAPIPVTTRGFASSTEFPSFMDSNTTATGSEWHYGAHVATARRDFAFKHPNTPTQSELDRLDKAYQAAITPLNSSAVAGYQDAPHLAPPQVPSGRRHITRAGGTPAQLSVSVRRSTLRRILRPTDT